ncbi:hypothetical protein D3C71_156420 [compost metagenome]
MTLSDERRRLRADYPHLTTRFKGARGNWECHLRIRTDTLGYFTIRIGKGASQREALLDVRAKQDAAFAGNSTSKNVEHLPTA